jgi:hypothetical protein
MMAFWIYFTITTPLILQIQVHFSKHKLGAAQQSVGEIVKILIRQNCDNLLYINSVSLVGKREEKRPLGRPGRQRDDCMKMYYKKYVPNISIWLYWLDVSFSVTFFWTWSEYSGSIKGRNFLTTWAIIRLRRRALLCPILSLNSEGELKLKHGGNCSTTQATNRVRFLKFISLSWIPHGICPGFSLFTPANFFLCCRLEWVISRIVP